MKKKGNFKAPLVLVRSVVARVKDTYNNQDLMHFAVALRSSGKLDLYCNFIKVSTVNIKGKEIISANIDFDKIYFTAKSKKETEVEKKEGEPKNWLYTYSIDLAQ